MAYQEIKRNRGIIDDWLFPITNICIRIPSNGVALYHIISLNIVIDKLLKGIFRQQVSCIHHDYIIAGSFLNTFIKSITSSFVRLRNDNIYLILIPAYNRHRLICRGSIYDDIFLILIRLINDASYGILYFVLTIIRYCDN